MPIRLSGIWHIVFKNMRWFFLACVALLITGCNNPDAPDFIKSTGEIKSAVRPLAAGIKTLVIEDNIDVVLRNDSIFQAEITAGANLIPKISIEPKNGELIVSNQNRVNWVRSYKPRIEVKLPGLVFNHLKINGFGEVRNSHILKVRTMQIWQYGSGTTSLKLDVDTLHTDVNGQGTLILEGKGKYAYSTVQKFALQNARAFETPEHDIRMFGYRSTYINPGRRMVAIVEGPGNVIYRRPLEQLLVYGEGTGKVVLTP